MVNFDLDDFKAVIDNGMNVDMSLISSCECTMNDCEQKCGKYYRCYSIALANDLLVAYEERM